MSCAWLVTGEVSGDRLGASILTRLRADHPGVAVRGVVGAELTDAGVEPLGRAEALQAMGLIEGARRLPAAVQMLRSLREALDVAPPDVVITVDAPSFSRHVGAMARRRGVPVVHVVAPQVWAWRRGRAARMKRWSSALACLLPWEPAWFASSGLDARWVGHPALLRGPLRRGDRLLLAPGSRAAEVRNLVPVFTEVARRTGLEPVWLIAPGVTFEAPGERVHRIEHARAGVALAASGTVTLELAASGIPQVAAYQLDRVSGRVARSLLQLHSVSLPNLFAGRRVVPEHLQRLEPARIAEDVVRLVGEDGRRQVELLGAALRPVSGRDPGRGVVELVARHSRAFRG